MAKHRIESTERSSPPVWRTKTGAGALIILMILVGTWFMFRWLAAPTAPDTHSIALDTQSTDATETEDGAAHQDGEQGSESSAGDIIVHVAGAVTTPGVVELAEGSRIIDAIELAGGVQDSADLEALNLAAQLSDGEYIYVPRRGEDPQDLPAAAAQSSGASVQASSSEGGDKVNVNTADETELQTLSGIGPAMAGRIIDYREANGPFQSLADLQGVSGIGPATAEKLEDHITW